MTLAADSRPCRMFMHRAIGRECPLMPHTGRAAALSAELAYECG
jgi:hypothetical protein